MITRRTLLSALALPALQTAALRQRAAAAKVLFGAAASWPALRDDQPYAQAFARECSILVPENVMKMGPVHPAPERYNFDPADFLADFAAKHDMKLRGHTLVWHQQMSAWFRTAVDKDNARRIFEDHIRTVAARYKGRMHSWDVVNETIQVGDDLPEAHRKTPWYDLLGPSYVENAFHLAHEADPKALLTYNDYGLDYDTPGDQAKRAAVLKLLRSLKSRRVPVHAFGMQAHLNGSRNGQFNGEILRRFLGEVAQLGLEIYITELDVIDRDLPADIAERDRIVAEAYSAYLTAALKEKAVTAVLTWGLSDKYTWLAGRNRRADGLPVRVLPLDRDMQPKPAWHAIAKAFESRK